MVAANGLRDPSEGHEAHSATFIVDVRQGQVKVVGGVVALEGTRPGAHEGFN